MGFEDLNLIKSQARERWVAGADFLSLKELPNETWLATGLLEGNTLEVRHITKVGLNSVAQELAKIESLTAAGFDFPFSLPLEFVNILAEHLKAPAIQSWQEIAEQIVFMPFEKFQEFVVSFKKEPKRFTDSSTQAATISPLHRGSPAMFQMTYQGIRLLASLDPKKYFVLPFQESIENGIAILEVHPRTILKCLGLPDTGYKSKEKKDRDKMHSVRHKLLQSLLNLKSQNPTLFKDCPRLILNKKLEQLIVESDQALDALLACYGTALWINNPDLFIDPLSRDNLDVLLEGWIYEPSKLISQ